MKEKFSSNNLENDEFSSIAKDKNYINLITRLKEVRTTIDLLQKIISEKI